MATDDRRLERIEAKQDDTNEHLSSIDKTLSSQAAILGEHIRRTELLENEFRPVRKFTYMVQGALALVLGLGAVWAIVEYVIK